MFSAISSDQSILSKDKHVKYWLRCLKTYLPDHYTSNDSNRMTLAFFTLSALDLLGVLHERTTISERTEYIDWIYLCQHPSGGFRGFTGSNFGDGLRNGDNGHWDPANLAGTFFALAALAVLGDGMERVKRKECLEWLTKLQCEDGSFGEVLGAESKIEGGGDVRFCYLATVVRWILQGPEQEYDDVKDIDIDKLAAFIMASQVRTKRYSDGKYGILTRPDIRRRDSQSTVSRSPRYASRCLLCRWVKYRAHLQTCSWRDILWYSNAFAAGKIISGRRRTQ